MQAIILILCRTIFFRIQEGKIWVLHSADEISGELTINVGKMSYDSLNGGIFGVNLRYPVTNDMEKTKEN